MKEKNGTYDEARVKKNVSTLENTRQKEVSIYVCKVNLAYNSSVPQLLVMHASARKGTCVEDEGCDWIFVPCAVSAALGRRRRRAGDKD